MISVVPNLPPYPQSSYRSWYGVGTEMVRTWYGGGLDFVPCFPNHAAKVVHKSGQAK